MPANKTERVIEIDHRHILTFFALVEWLVQTW